MDSRCDIPQLKRPRIPDCQPGDKLEELFHTVPVNVLRNKIDDLPSCCGYVASGTEVEDESSRVGTKHPASVPPCAVMGPHDPNWLQALQNLRIEENNAVLSRPRTTSLPPSYRLLPIPEEVGSDGELQAQFECVLSKLPEETQASIDGDNALRPPHYYYRRPRAYTSVRRSYYLTHLASLEEQARQIASESTSANVSGTASAMAVTPTTRPESRPAVQAATVHPPSHVNAAPVPATAPAVTSLYQPPQETSERAQSAVESSPEAAVIDTHIPIIASCSMSAPQMAVAL